MKLQALVQLSVVLLAVACATVPITGRTQLRFVSNAELAAEADGQYAAFSAIVDRNARFVTGQESPETRRLVETVRRVTTRIVEAAGLQSRHAWETVVVDASNVNAFVMPNGKIVVFRGLLPVAKTEAGLAAVIGHEVGHHLAEHRGERLSQAIIAQAAATAVDIAFAVAGSPYHSLAGAVMGLGGRFGLLLPFERFHESEADQIGLFLMAKAGYDPREALSFWERMAAASGSGPWAFLSTHPNSETRLQDVRGWIPEARTYYEDRTLPLPANLTEARARRAQRDQLLAAAPIATAPSFPVGYWLKFQAGPFTTFTYRLDRVEECPPSRCLRFVSSLGGSHLYTERYEQAETRVNADTWFQFDPPLRLFQWPLRVGDSWSHGTTMTTSKGLRVPTKFDGTVLAYDIVTTKAGSFAAFHVRTNLAGRAFKEFWYAPQARTLVKVTEYGPDRAVTSELVDYDKTQEPSTPLSGARAKEASR